MFSVLTGNVPLSYTVNEGILQIIKGGTPSTKEAIHLLDISGNEILDIQDYELTTRRGRISEIYSSDGLKLIDMSEFLLGVRG